jgi:hypothetical protein
MSLSERSQGRNDVQKSSSTENTFLTENRLLAVIVILFMMLHVVAGTMMQSHPNDAPTASEQITPSGD